MATQEQLDLRAKWVAALRSGEYQQGTGYLCRDNEYCCLGVMCEVAGIPSESNLPYEDGLTYYNFPNEERSAYVVRQFLVDKIGLTDEVGIYSTEDGDEETLAGMNDRGVPFARIADVIESAPSGLFKD